MIILARFFGLIKLQLLDFTMTNTEKQQESFMIKLMCQMKSTSKTSSLILPIPILNTSCMVKSYIPGEVFKLATISL